MIGDPRHGRRRAKIAAMARARWVRWLRARPGCGLLPVLGVDDLLRCVGGGASFDPLIDEAQSAVAALSGGAP